MNKQQNLRMKHKELLERRIQKLKKLDLRLLARLDGVFSLRLALATCFFVFLILIAMGIWVNQLILAALIVAVFFIVAVVITRRIRRHVEQIEFLIHFFQRTILRLEGRPGHSSLFSTNPSFLDHPLARDLDLVGQHSLLDLLDESISPGGQTQLIRWMLTEKPKKEDLTRRHEQIVEFNKTIGLAKKWIRTSKSGLRTDAAEMDSLLKESLVFDRFQSTHRTLWALCVLTWLLFIAKLLIGVQTYFGLFLIAYVFLSIFALRKIEHVFSQLQDITLRLDGLITPFQIIEKQSHRAIFKDHLYNFNSSPPTKSLKRFRSIFSMISVQSHPLIMFLINSILPWNYYFVSLAEKERTRLAADFSKIVEQFHWYDALNSLALFYHFQSRNFPIFSETLKLQYAIHPLIENTSVVANDFEWPEEKTLILITGSNMAGKSTFLRTVGMNLILAKMGAPVFAEVFHAPLIPLVSCIRVSDSVREGYSYFYAETLRVAELLKRSQKEGIIFFIDEVFKGTNNRERYVGGLSLIHELTKTNSQGFITTHDLELSKLNNNKMANFHFRDEVKNGEMIFSYKIHSGPCPTTNALKIMSLSGIPIHEL